MKELKVISLFDGMSCGALALDQARVPVGTYVSSEIEKYPMMVSRHTYPHIKQVGDVCDLNPNDFKDFDILIGGSPCQSMSGAGKGKGLTTNTGRVVNNLPQYLLLKDFGYSYNKNDPKYFHSSCLFWEYVRILRGIQEHNPDVKFLLENVVNKEWGQLITKELGVEPIRINSSEVSAQNRDRYYWTNIEYTSIRKRHCGLTLDSVIPDAVAGAGSRGVPQKNWVKTPDNPFLHKQNTTVRPDGLANCLTASGGKICRRYLSTDGTIKDISVEQAEQLQTVPVGYTDVPGVSPHQRFKMLGNGWTVDVIAHFFTCLKLEIESYGMIEV
jgi:hypothetical protein